jgi:hypothetical protein
MRRQVQNILKDIRWELKKLEPADAAEFLRLLQGREGTVVKWEVDGRLWSPHASLLDVP